MTDRGPGPALHPSARLTGPAVRLDPLGPEHFDDTWAWVNDPESARLTGTTTVFTAGQVRAHLETVAAAGDRADWAIVDRSSGRYRGEIVLNDLDAANASMNVRIALAPGEPGRGIGTEAMILVLDHAFTDLRLHRVALDVFDFNVRAQRSYRKAGFVVEGRCRQTVRTADGWADSILMAVLADDPRPTLR
ncbi:GNAT family N-acetyltransferase [Nakamurella sp.]|uniref:GNAT family N-acetyltransferase n=1 Tax=Nakamurella sp. TaxID=1869182 RepID=UPI003B3B1262